MKNKEWLTRRPQHLFARVVCLLLAVITWLCVMRVSPPTYDATLTNVSIRVVDAEGVAYTGELDSDRMPKVRIKGTKEALATVTAMGVISVMVPTEVPMAVEIKQLTMNKTKTAKRGGMKDSTK